MNTDTPPTVPDPARQSVRNPPPLAGFGPVFAWGARIAFRPKRFLLITVVAVALGALVGATGVANRNPWSSRYKWYYLWSLLDRQTLQYLLPLCALLFVTPGFSREVQQRTLVYHLVRPVSRTTIFLARFASGLVPAIFVGTLMLWSVLWTSGLSVPGSVVVSVALVAALDALLLGAIYYMLASIFRWGTIAGLVYTFVIETVVGAARGALQNFSMSYHVRSFYRALVNDEFAARSQDVAREIDPDVEIPLGEVESIGDAAMSILQKPVYETATTAVIVSVILTACFLAFGVWRTKRRDFPLKD